MLRNGDNLLFSRDGSGDFSYRVVRGSETIFGAGTVPPTDGGGPIAIWQEHDQRPNPWAERANAEFTGWPVAETIPVRRPYITVRIQDQVFHLQDRQEVEIYPYYAYLARSNEKVPELAFEFTPRAVHAAGSLETVSKELIIDAARQLTRPQTRML